MQTQNEQIEQFLLDGNTIDHIVAAEKFGCRVLNSRISDLRARGYNIEQKDNGKNYAEHYIDITKKYGIWNIEIGLYLQRVQINSRVFTWTSEIKEALPLRVKLVAIVKYLKEVEKLKIKVVEL